MRKESMSTKILRANGNSEVVKGLCDGLPLAGQGINALLGLDFLSAHYAEVAVAILLKMIFRVFSFSSTAVVFTSKQLMAHEQERIQKVLVGGGCNFELG